MLAFEINLSCLIVDGPFSLFKRDGINILCSKLKHLVGLIILTSSGRQAGGNNEGLIYCLHGRETVKTARVREGT